MTKRLFLSALLLGTASLISLANNTKTESYPQNQTEQAASRLAELDKFWSKLSKAVSDGDFESYKAAYHEDAVIIFASGKNKTSLSITQALAGWKQGFDNTKAGKQKDNVEFRFSQRIGNENTAHETGIFIFTSTDSSGKNLGKFIIHFEMLFVKRDNQWLAMMEYQKSNATKKEWDDLK